MTKIKQNNSFRINVANYIIKITYSPIFPIKEIANNFLKYTGKKQTDFSIYIDINDKSNNLVKRISKSKIIYLVKKDLQCNLHHKYCSNIIFKITRFTIEYLLLSKKVILLHGSSIKSPSGGIAFCGPSGSGKTTIIQKINLNNIMSDDTVVIRYKNKKILLFTSPFDRKKFPKLQFNTITLKEINFIYKSISNKKCILTRDEDKLNEILGNNRLYQLLTNDKRFNKAKKNNYVNKLHTIPIFISKIPISFYQQYNDILKKVFRNIKIKQLHLRK